MDQTQSKRSVHVWLYVLLGIALIGTIIWGASQTKRVKAVTLTVENQYNRAFHELVGYVDDIDTLLDKSMLVTSAAQLATISGDIFRQSASAKACIGQLPTSDIQLDNTAKFLSQVGDYTSVLSQNMINGGKVSDEDYQNIASLSEYAKSLKQALGEIEQEVYNGNIDFSQIAMGKKSNKNDVKAASGDLLQDLEKVEKSFEEYPSLIYDGPFSEHIENTESVMLKDSTEITQEQALEKASSFLEGRGVSLQLESDIQNSAIDAYSFVNNENQDRQISITITKKGGYVLYFLDSRSVMEEKLGINEAIDTASKFLKEKGIESLKNSYYEKADGIATINFAYQQDNVTCYSDLIKVRVALDNGEILGMETKGYLMNHQRRSFSAPKLTEAEARTKINPQLAIDTVNLALVPKDSLKEVLCYEFKGTFQDKNYIIYINADNGHEERILLLIESEDGILTI
jgi:spore germination protein